MSNPRYPEEFKIQAVNQVTEKKLPVSDVAARLGVSTHSLYAWIRRCSERCGRFLRAQTFKTHQPRHTMPTTILTDLAQIVMDFSIAINNAALQP